MLEPAALTFLETLAAASIRFGLDHCAPLLASPRAAPACLQRRQGAFVGLSMAGRNRGCQGDTFAKHALFDSVRLAAHRSAFRDRRYSPLTPALLGKVDLQVHVLDEHHRRVPDAGELAEARGEHDSVLMHAPRASAFLLAGACVRYGSTHELRAALLAKAGVDDMAGTPLHFYYIHTQSGPCRPLREIGGFDYEW